MSYVCLHLLRCTFICDASCMGWSPRVIIYNTRSTILSRKHNNANVMTIGAKLIKKVTALKCVDIFLRTNFEGGRHNRRIKKI